MFKKFLTVLLIATTIFTVSGLGVLSQPKPAEAAAWLTIDIDEQLNRVLVAIWKFAIFPILKKLVVKLASGDLSINGLELITTFAKDLAFQSLQAVLLTYTGFSLCSDIRGNMRTAFARAGTPGEYIPDCTFDRSIIKKGFDIVRQLGNSTNLSEAAKVAERELTSRFAISLQGSNNDFGTWFGLRSNFLEQNEKKQQNYRFELLVNQGFFGARDCGKLNVPGSTKAEAEAAPKVKKTAKKKTASAKTVDKYKDCRIKSPGLMFAEDAKKRIEGVKQGSIQATALQDIIALSAIFIDTLIETSLTGFWNAVTNTGTTSLQSSESQGSDFQRTGQNAQIEWPQSAN